MSAESLKLNAALLTSLRTTRDLVGYSIAELADETAALDPGLAYRRLRSKEYGDSPLLASELMVLGEVLGPLDSWVVPPGDLGEVWKKYRNI